MPAFGVFVSLGLLLWGALYLKKLWVGAVLALVSYLGIVSFINLKSLSIIAPIINAVVISAELGLLLFGAYLFFKILQSNNHFDALHYITQSISSRIAIILILCYFWGSFMEGIAGFGIPAMLIAPMLFTLGFKPLTCVVLPLAANTTAVTFGALGTPLKFGLGIMEPNQIVFNTLLLNVIPAILLPSLLAFLYSKTENESFSWRKNTFMLFGAGFFYTIIYFISGLCTVEYTSVISGIFGLMIFSAVFTSNQDKPKISAWAKTFSPYFLFVVLLLVARYFFSDIHLKISENIRVISMYQPGAIFIFTALLYHLITEQSPDKKIKFMDEFSTTFNMLKKTVITILLLVCYAQLIRKDMEILSANYLSDLSETASVFVSPLLGVLGSFLSGSATMSNLIFGGAFSVNNSSMLAALLHTGSAIGNAISLQNILMVMSVINKSNINYSEILKLNLKVVFFYLLVVTIIALTMIG